MFESPHRARSRARVTARISGFSRAPWQTEQVRRLMYWRMRWRVSSLSVVVVEMLELRDHALERLCADRVRPSSPN